MIRPTKHHGGDERLRPVPRRNGASPFLSQQQGMRIINVHVAVPNNFDPNTSFLAPPSNMYSSSNNNAAFGTMMPPRPSPTPVLVSPTSAMYPSACSPLTVCSDTWRHSPSPIRQQQQPPTSISGGFVPIAESEDISVAPSPVAPSPVPLSWALRTLPKNNNEESTYRPYASPYTAETSSVTTVGTNRSTATTPTPTATFPPIPPLYTRPRPMSSLAMASSASLMCIPISTAKTAASKSRPKSAPTLPVSAADDDKQRKIRLKTELCTHYEKNGTCPFKERTYSGFCDSDSWLLLLFQIMDRCFSHTLLFYLVL